MRIHKYLAQSGIASRRKSESLIRAGRVTVNDERAVIGQQIDPLQDDIRVDGKRVQMSGTRVYIALHKPPGVISSTRSHGGDRTVLDLVQSAHRLYPVGRLDKESEGLILLTDDGELTNLLTHPRYGHEKEYQVQLDCALGEAILSKWRKGPTLSTGEKLAPIRIDPIQARHPSNWYALVMKEGKKRQIRRTAQHFGCQVLQLVRTRIGNLHLGTLKPGEWRYLTREEAENLLDR